MSDKTDVVLTRVKAFKLAWSLFWFATGTSRVGITAHPDTNSFEIVGNDLIKE